MIRKTPESPIEEIHRTRREISDRFGGDIAAYGGRHECEYYYEFLNRLEDSEYDKEVETYQREEVETDLAGAISVMQPLYEMFMEHFRAHVARELR